MGTGEPLSSESDEDEVDTRILLVGEEEGVFRSMRDAVSDCCDGVESLVNCALHSSSFLILSFKLLIDFYMLSNLFRIRSSFLSKLLLVLIFLFLGLY